MGTHTLFCSFLSGQHHVVAVINNFYDKSDLEYYTIPRGRL